MKDTKNIQNIRNQIINISYETKSAHLGSSLSCVEILYSIFKLSSDKKKIKNDIIFSKGHAALAYYVTLQNFGYLKKKTIQSYLQKKTNLWSHITYQKKGFYFKFSFGSLGYGPGIAAGLSLGYKNLRTSNNIFCIVSDGELNEGSIWESLMFISHRRLNNITILIDCNRWQSFGSTKDVINLDPLGGKLKSFGFEVFSVNGHNINKITKLLKKKTNKPKIIICNTIKGKGLTRIQNTLESHYIPAKKTDIGKAK